MAHSLSFTVLTLLTTLPLTTASAQSSSPGKAHLFFQGSVDASGKPDYVAQGKSYYFTDETATFRVTPSYQNNYATGVRFWVIQGNYDSWWDLNLSQPRTISTQENGRLIPGIYEGALRFPFNENSPGLDLSGDGRGCNKLSGRFVVHEAEYCSQSQLRKFSASFVQYCENRTSEPVFGSVSYESSSRCASSRPVRETARAKKPLKQAKKPASKKK
jgi:hypothetical protein